MPNPTRPTDLGFWGGTAVTPTTPQRTTGYTPNFRPPAEWFNWFQQLFYSWMQYLDFVTQVFATAAISPIANELATFVSGTTWTVSETPVNAETTSVSVDGMPQIGNWTLTGRQITFTSNAPGAGQAVVVDYFVTSVGNITALISSSSGAFAVYGSTSSPNQVTASGGISSTGDARALMFLSSSGGSVAVTAVPQISAGTTIGQELRLVGTSDVNYIVLADGNGLAMNGSVALQNNVVQDLFWNGTVWVDSGRNN